MTNSIADSKQTSIKSIFTKYKNIIPIIICIGIPIFLLTGAYLHMCFRYNKWWLFNTIVHENGRYTLLETIFYFRHFIWESLILIIYAFFIVGAFFFFGKASATKNNPTLKSIPFVNIFLSGIFVLGILVFSIILAAESVGIKDTLLGLLQYRTSVLRPMEYGSHWRNHFLSNIVLFSSSVISIIFYRMISQGGYWRKSSVSSLFYFAIGLFVFLTILFGFTMDPFETPSYLGHQLREVFGADCSIIMFLALAVLIYLENKYDPVEICIGELEINNRKKNLRFLIFWVIPVLFIILFLIIKVLSLDISSEIDSIGKTENWTTIDLFAWHFFEHSLDYIFTVFLVYFLYLATLKTELKKAIH